MPIFDLPPELWLEILSYLPDDILPKILGVSRTLFEMALVYRYEDVHISHGKETRRSLEQLITYPDIAKRVRHITLHPDLLHREVAQPTWRRYKSSMWLSRLKLSKKTFHRDVYEVGKQFSILDLTIKAIKHCSNLRQVALQIAHNYDDRISFLRFADSLRMVIPIQSNLTELVINRNLYSQYSGLSKDFKRLFTIEPFRFSAISGDPSISLSITASAESIPKCSPAYLWEDSCRILAGFVNSVTHTIFSITISSTLESEDIADLFRGLNVVPNLQEFKLLAVFNYQTFSNKQLVTTFLQKHANSLEVLCIKPERLSTSSYSNVDFGTYPTWLVHEPPEYTQSLTFFTQLFLPKLHTLEIGLQEIGTENNTPLLPDLYHVAPMLKKLMLSNVKLTIESLSLILKRLARVNNQVILEELSFTCDTISPFTFDFLSKTLLRLKSLTVEYASTVVDLDADDSASFYACMKTRRYPLWPLQYLRLSLAHSCGQGHPSQLAMIAVASAISTDVVLDTKRHCSCTTVIDLVLIESK